LNTLGLTQMSYGRARKLSGLPRKSGSRTVKSHLFLSADASSSQLSRPAGVHLSLNADALNTLGLTQMSYGRARKLSGLPRKSGSRTVKSHLFLSVLSADASSSQRHPVARYCTRKAIGIHVGAAVWTA